MANKPERIRSDKAGVGPDPSYTGELVSINDLRDFRVAEGEPDIRGWDVCTIAGVDIGGVDDLLIDPRRAEVVMLDVDLRGTDRHAEVPLRAVQLDRGRRIVIVDSGDVDEYATDTRRERLGTAERESLRERLSNVFKRDVRYDLRDREVRERQGEAVLDSKRVMEEVIVRRRPIDDEPTRKR